MTENSTGFAPILIGAGGHAAVLIETLTASGQLLPLVAIDADPALRGNKLLGVPIDGGDERIPDWIARGASRFIVGVGSAASTASRMRIFNLALAWKLSPCEVLHPAANCSPSSCRGAGLQLLAGAIVGPRSILGENVLINHGAIVDHDAQIGDHVHVAIGACICGNVRIGDGAHIGAGATVIQGVSIGANAVVGAGAVVIKDVPPGAVVVGVPARNVR